MNSSPDIVLSDSYGRPIAWVETLATRRLHGSVEMAIFYQYEIPRFFMLITLVELSLWDKTPLKPYRAVQGDKFPTVRGELPRYLKEQVSKRAMHHSLLTDAAFGWLVHLREFGVNSEDDTERRLGEAGFVEAIRDSKVEFGAAA